jgi:hypothetical protein
LFDSSRIGGRGIPLKRCCSGSTSARNGRPRFVTIHVDGNLRFSIVAISMKKILLTGLPAAVDTELLKERMTHFGPVIQVSKIDEGDPDRPWVVVEMDLDLIEAQEAARRIDGIYYLDRFIGAHVLTYG